MVMTSRRRVLHAAAAAGAALVMPACHRQREAPQAANSSSAGLRIDVRHTPQGEERIELVALRRERASPSLHRELPDWGDYRLTLSDTASRNVIARIGFDSNIDADLAGA